MSAKISLNGGSARLKFDENVQLHGVKWRLWLHLGKKIQKKSTEKHSFKLENKFIAGAV